MLESHKIFPFIEYGLHIGSLHDVQIMASGTICHLAAKTLISQSYLNDCSGL